jgi:hypothetical protein
MKNLVQKNHSLLTAINENGIMKHSLQDKSYNGESFTKFVSELIYENQLKDT